MPHPRNRDVKAAGTFDHPTQFAAVAKTADDVTLPGGDRHVGDLVSLLETYNGDHINGRIVEDFGDGTYRVEVTGRDGRIREYFEAGFDLDEPLPYTYGDLVVITDLDSGVRLTGRILRPGFGPGRWEVEVTDGDGSYAADFHGANLSQPTLADRAFADPYQYFPGTDPNFPGVIWGVKYSEHWQAFDINNGYMGAPERLFPRRRVFGFDEAGNEVIQPGDVVVWTTSEGHTAEEANTIWERRDEISAGLLDQGFGGGSIRIRVVLDGGSVEVRPYDWSDDFTPFRIA